ncbi:flavodoxin family protein [Mesorhizobium sp. B2-4-9]|uniref:FMN-dependent NADH-azoreductase n=1 Tax=Mesorhizobium sp. B2-4-9 TaxID=2589940 RepID=UPI00112CDACB|nr:NAD(P)H-dependent oxidoreductase [Mesorhizobium sp. B2-4-9]TPL23427.1 flavodoxin family protein [Mesorhizobium sp. B2-4-9]
MTKILWLTFSPRGENSESYKLSAKIVELLLQKHAGATVFNHAFGDGSIAHVDENYAISQGSAADVSKDGSMARSEELVKELEIADIIVIGTPMHNLSVPSTLKAWIDHIVRARRTFNITAAGKVGTLRDRPVYIAIASGGRFSGEKARQPDFLTPYLRAVLGIAGLHDLRFFSVQGTGAGPDVTAETRRHTHGELEEHFAPISAVG